MTCFGWWGCLLLVFVWVVWVLFGLLAVCRAGLGLLFYAYWFYYDSDIVMLLWWVRLLMWFC